MLEPFCSWGNNYDMLDPSKTIENVSSMCSYDEGRTGACFFDVWARNAPDSVQMLRQCIYPGTAAEPIKPDQHTLETVNLLTYNNLNLQAEDVPYLVTLPDRSRIAWWEDEATSSHIQFHVSHIDDDFPSFAGTLYPPTDEPDEDNLLEWQRYAFAPTMGRLCFLDKDNMLRVLDFVG